MLKEEAVGGRKTTTHIARTSHATPPPLQHTTPQRTAQHVSSHLIDARLADRARWSTCTETGKYGNQNSKRRGNTCVLCTHTLQDRKLVLGVELENRRTGELENYRVYLTISDQRAGM
jgi:hypothetical protein